MCDRKFPTCMIIVIVIGVAAVAIAGALGIGLLFKQISTKSADVEKKVMVK